MEEDLITFETSKLAKELGFDEDAYHFYNENGTFVTQMSENINYYEKYKAVTQFLLQKWIREKYNLAVWIPPLRVSTASESGFRYTWIITDVKIDEDWNDETPLGFLTYEEALEIGLQEALQIIKKKK